LDFKTSLVTKKPSLQDVLLRQLGMFADTDEDFRIGQEIIGNIDENGYLKANLAEISAILMVPVEQAEKVLKLIQKFEPIGVAARSVSECLLVQLELANENDPILHRIIESHLEDVAKKNFSHIAKSLKEPLEKIESCIKKILKLNPKPGRNYSSEQINNVIPDIIIEEKGEDLEVSINNEDIPTVSINKDYKAMLKDKSINPQTKEFMKEKLRQALELLRSIYRRQRTLRKVIDAILEIQHEAVRDGLSNLKALTFQEIAQKIGMHESTVCRVVMNKYVQTPHGIVALKDLFSSHVHDENGQSISSTFVKSRLKELIDQEDKKHPLSDEGIVGVLLKENGLKVSRRTVAKYREELKILSTSFRRVR
jgi:RNA polymerase sigma-54 factor